MATFNELMGAAQSVKAQSTSNSAPKSTQTAQPATNRNDYNKQEYGNRVNSYLQSKKTDYTSTKGFYDEAIANANKSANASDKKYWTDIAGTMKSQYNYDNRTEYNNLINQLNSLTEAESTIKKNRANANRSAHISMAATTSGEDPLKKSFELGQQLKQNQSEQARINELIKQLDTDIETVNMNDDVRGAIERLTANNYGRKNKDAKAKDQQLVDDFYNGIGLQARYFNKGDRVAGTVKSSIDTMKRGYAGAAASGARAVDYGMGIGNVEGNEYAGYMTDAVSASNFADAGDNYEQKRAEYTQQWEQAGGNNTMFSNAAQTLENYAKNMGEQASAELAKTKEGLGKFGQFMVDAGSNMLNIGADMAIGAATGGASLVPMLMRVYGESYSEAKEKGAGYGQSVGYGLTKAAIEGVSEKMFGAFDNIGYGRGFLPVGGIEDVLMDLAKSDVGKYMVKGLYSSTEEGLEEVFSDLASPFAEWIINEEKRGHYFSEIEAKELFRDYLLGATLGGLGNVMGTGSTIAEINQGNLAKLSEASMAQARGEVLSPEMQMRMAQGGTYGGLTLKQAAELRNSGKKPGQTKEEKQELKAEKKWRKQQELRQNFEQQANRNTKGEEKAEEQGPPGKHEGEVVQKPGKYEAPEYEGRHSGELRAEEQAPTAPGKHEAEAKEYTGTHEGEERKGGAHTPEAVKAEQKARDKYQGQHARIGEAKAEQQAPEVKEETKPFDKENAPKPGLKYEDTSAGRKATKQEANAKKEAAKEAVTPDLETANTTSADAVQNKVRSGVSKRTSAVLKAIKSKTTLTADQKLTKAEAREAVANGTLTEYQAHQATLTDEEARTLARQEARQAEFTRTGGNVKAIEARRAVTKGQKLTPEQKLTSKEFATAVEAGLLSPKDAKTYRLTKAEEKALKNAPAQGEAKAEAQAPKTNVTQKPPKKKGRGNRGDHTEGFLNRSTETGYSSPEAPEPLSEGKKEEAPTTPVQPQGEVSAPESTQTQATTPESVKPAEEAPQQSKPATRWSTQELRDNIQSGTVADEDIEDIIDSDKGRRRLAQVLGYVKPTKSELRLGWKLAKAAQQTIAEAEANNRKIPQSDIEEMLAHGGISAEQYRQLMVDNGYRTQEWADKAKANSETPANPVTKSAPVKKATEQERWKALYDAGQITAGEYYTRLASNGIITSEEASKKIAEAKTKSQSRILEGEDAVNVLLEEDPAKRYERQKGVAQNGLKKLLADAAKSENDGVIFEDRPNTRDPEFRDYWKKEANIDVRRVTREQLERMNNATQDNPMFFTTRINPESKKYSDGIRYESWKYDGANLVRLQIGENGEIIGSPLTIGPYQLAIQARYINGMDHARSYSQDKTLGQRFFGEAGQNPAQERASKSKKAKSTTEQVEENTDNTESSPEETENNKQNPPPEKEMRAQPSSTKKEGKSAVHEEVYIKDATKNMKAESPFEWGKYDSATTEEVSRVVDERVEQHGVKVERDRLAKSDNWDRTDFAEAQWIITRLSLDLYKRMANDDIKDDVEYQSERLYIDELMEKYRQMKSEAGQKLQQKYKISVADEIRMRAAHRFLSWSPNGDGRIFGYNKYSQVYRTIDNMLKAAEKASKANSVDDMIKVIEDSSYIRGNQKMFGKVGTELEHAGLEFLKSKGVKTEDFQNILYGNINRMIDDFDTVRPINAIVNFRTLNMLSAARTAINNVLNNAAGMKVGAVAHNLGYLAARQFEKATGKKVAIKDSSTTRLKNDTLGAEATAFVASALMAYYGINIENGRLDIDNVAKFNPDGNFFERLGSRYAFLVNTFVMNPDQMGKARVDKGLQSGIDEVFKDVEMTPEMQANKLELEAYKEHEKNRRLVQADNATVKLVQHFKDYLNKVKIGNNNIGYLKLGDFAMPFAKVPVNIVQQRIAATPYGALYHLLNSAKGYHDAVKMHEDVVRGIEGAKEMSAADMAKYSRDVGRAVTTGGMLAIGAIAAMTGALRDFGNDDDDDDETKIWRNKGYDGLTLNISAMLEMRNEWHKDDWVVGAGFLEIFAAPLAIGALAWEAHKDDMNLMQAAWYATQRSFTDVLDAISDIPGMQAASQLYESYTYAPAGDANLSKVGTAIGQYLANSASGYIMPNAVTQFATGYDNTIRNPYYADSRAQQYWQIFANKMPFLRNTLPAKLDMWGRPKQYAENRFLAILNKEFLPGAVRQIKSDKYEDEIIRLSQAGYKNMLPVTNAPNKIEAGEETYTLTKDQKIAYEQAYKDRYREYRDVFMDSAEYKKLTDEQRVGVLKQLKLDAGRVTKQEFLESVDSPEIVTMSKWETDLESLEDQISFLSAKQMADSYWDSDENAVSDYAAMDKFIQTEYGKLSEDVRGLLDNSLSHLDDMFGAWTTAKITSEQWQKAYDIYSHYANGKDANGNKLYKANLANASEMWSKIEKATKATDKQMQWFEKNMKLRYQGSITAEDSQYYEYLYDAGLSRTEASKAIQAVAELPMMEGYSSVQQSQKYNAIVSSVPASKQWRAFWAIVPSNASKKKIENMRMLEAEGTSLQEALKQTGMSEVKGKKLLENGKWQYWTISK